MKKERKLPHNNASTNLYQYNGQTCENKMLIDEVVGGGQMIRVQDEGIDQFSEFNISPEQGLAPLGARGRKSEGGAQNAFKDNFGQIPPDAKT